MSPNPQGRAPIPLRSHPAPVQFASRARRIARGCAVIWGNPERARHLVSFEGIENGAVGAYALRPEIEANEIYVASAINAAGVEALTPYPAMELVTVGADRDEAKEGAGYQRGERAARTFAMRNRDRVEVKIGLPGEARVRTG